MTRIAGGRSALLAAFTVIAAAGNAIAAPQDGAPTVLAATTSQNSVTADSSESAAILKEITVTASRLPSDLKSFPGTVTVIGPSQIETQTALSNDLDRLLTLTVPSLAASSIGSYSNYSQSLRGRKPAVFIDGVPVTVSLRDGARDSRLISPGAIDNVEVVSGATSIYGLGGAGGLINYVTRNPGTGPVSFDTTVSAAGSATHPSDSLNWSLDQDVSGRTGNLGYVASGYYESYSSLFDADGDRIPPDPQLQGGIADTDTYNLFGKLVYDLTSTQRVQFWGSLYRTDQKTDYSAGVGLFGVTKTPAIPVAPLGEPEYTHDAIASLQYENGDFLGSVLDVDAYFNDYSTVFNFKSAPAYFPPTGGQSVIFNDVEGLRSTVNTPLNIGSGGGSLLWGLDYSYTRSRQGLTDGRTWVPHLASSDLAPFGQLNLPVTSWLVVDGGVRWELQSISAATFTTIAETSKSLGGVTVQGGTLSYSKPVFNAGVVLSPFKSGWLSNVDAYADYSQGFILADLGLVLRDTKATSIKQFAFQPQIVDSYELGLRAHTARVQGHVAVYYSTSDLGATYNPITLLIDRAPQRIYGTEFALDAKLAESLTAGGSVSWLDGQTEAAGTSAWSPLPDSVIPPLKVIAYAQDRLITNLLGRVQVTYSAHEGRFPGNPALFGESDIPAYTLVDLLLSYTTRTGTWSLAADNVLNERYFTPDSWIYASNTEFTEGVGTTLKLTYSISY